MGGAFDIHQFLDGYYDDNCYYNCPPDFLPNLNDPGILDRYRRMKIVLATGENRYLPGRKPAVVGHHDREGNPASAGRLGRRHRSRLALVGANGAEVFLAVVRKRGLITLSQAHDPLNHPMSICSGQSGLPLFLNKLLRIAGFILERHRDCVISRERVSASPDLAYTHVLVFRIGHRDQSR